MLDAPRMVRLLLAAGLTPSQIARQTKLSKNAIRYIGKFCSKNSHVTSIEKLHDTLYKKYDFPWSRKAAVQLREMAIIARSENPSVLTELYGYSLKGWIKSIREARRRYRISEEEWTKLALGYLVLLGDLRRKSKQRERYADELKTAWGMVSHELLRRLEQLDTASDVDRSFVEILRYDVVQNQITASWELSKMTPIDVRNLKKFVGEVDYFQRYEEFNTLLPGCLTTHFNALGIASALKRRSLYRRIWDRLVAVDSKYASLSEFRDDEDAGPEFSDFFAWADKSAAVAAQQEAKE